MICGTRSLRTSIFFSSADHQIHHLLEGNIMVSSSFLQSTHLSHQESRSACDRLELDNTFSYHLSFSHRCILPQVASNLTGRYVFLCPIFTQDRWVDRVRYYSNYFGTKDKHTDWPTIWFMYLVESCMECGHNVCFSFIVCPFAPIPGTASHGCAPFWNQSTNLTLEQTYRLTLVHALRWDDHRLHYFKWISQTRLRCA